MKKIKSFSLIEILIASSIFMFVAIMAAASFGMVRRANDRARDLKNTGECREILQNFVESGVNNSSKEPRIMGIIGQGDGYLFKDIKIANDGSLQDQLQAEDIQFSGLAMFLSDGSYSVIYKDKNQKYLYKEFAQNDPDITLPSEGEIVPAASEFLKTGNQSCYGSPVSLGSATPFKIWGVKNNNRSSHLFTVVLEDNLYNIQNPTSQDQNFSYLSLRVSNGEGSF